MDDLEALADDRHPRVGLTPDAPAFAPEEGLVHASPVGERSVAFSLDRRERRVDLVERDDVDPPRLDDGRAACPRSP